MDIRINRERNEMIVKRTNSEDIDFQELVKALNAELKVRDGDEHASMLH